MLEQIFLKILDMSLSASMIIAVVFLVRLLLKRFPKFISCMLWSVVFFRLLCPVTLESELSLVPNLEPAFYEYMTEKDVAPVEGESGGFAAPNITGEIGNVPETGGITSGQVTSDETISDTTPSDRITPIENTSEQNTSEQSVSGQFTSVGNVKTVEVSWQDRFILFGKYVWIFGTGVLLFYCVISTVKILNKVSSAFPFRENIYITDETVTPFVMGLFHPSIYIPEALSEEEQEYIILHEKFHIRHLDHVIKPAAFVALCIHWFNPLVWIAFFLLCMDMEMSCDEAVIKKMGEDIRADYSLSLLTVSTGYRIFRGIPAEFGKGDTKERIKNLAAFRKTKKGVLAVLTAGVVILIVCLASTRKLPAADADGSQNEIAMFPDTNFGDGIASAEDPAMPEPLTVSLDIAEHYKTHVGDPDNLYYIDENNVLWGSGRNDYGQLGQGTHDNEFHSEMVKIAEHVIDVDYSQSGFVIFLTEDHLLYGMGNAESGALLQYAGFDPSRYEHGVSEPYLLMGSVKYARCGREDVVCLTEDGAVWTWGTNWNLYVERPQKILENAVLVTGGWFNHAALLQDGTVWTWGYNFEGNCGVAGFGKVSEPTKVAEGVVMVWTDIIIDDFHPDADDLVMAWTGRLRYNTDYKDIAGFGGRYPNSLSNTVIRKADGSYWVCGENVGTERIEMYSEQGFDYVDGVDYTTIATYEFYPCGYNLEAQQIEEAKAAEGWFTSQINETMYFFLDEQTGWRLVVTDAAAGSRFYVLERTEDGGNSWDTIHENPFDGAYGVAEGLIFYDEDFGYAGLAGASGPFSWLYVTHDGGLTFEEVILPMDTVTELPKSGQSYGFTVSDYDYYRMPEQVGDTLYITVTTAMEESDGILFMSEDHGNSWIPGPARLCRLRETETVIEPTVLKYSFEEAMQAGTVQEIKGLLPGASEGIWYIIEIDGVEYYYGRYDFQESENAGFYGWSVVSEDYSLANGIRVGMAESEIQEQFPDMAVLDFDNHAIYGEVFGCMGWNGTAYPRSRAGMDSSLDYGEDDYYRWTDQFDYVMIADIALGGLDTRPMYLALMMKEHTVAAITFYYPTAD